MNLIRTILPALLVVTVLSSLAEARVSRNQVQPAPAAAPGGKVATCEPVKCCPRNVCYRHHPGCGCYDPCKKMELILQVKDPCTCCLVEVPVCIPACCTAAPSVCCYQGFLRRQVVEYSWSCGFYLKVVFDRCGDVTVHYYGC